MDVDTFQFMLQTIETLAKTDDDNKSVVADNVEQAHRLLQRCIQEVQSQQLVGKDLPDDKHADGNATTASTPFVLTATPFIHVLRGWAKTGQPDVLEDCRALFAQMEQLHQNDPIGFPNPHQKHVYSAILYACGQSSHADARQIAEEWMQVFVDKFPLYQQQRSLDSDKNEHDDSTTNSPPLRYLPVEIYNQIMLIHASRAATEYGAAAAAEDWLVHLSQLHTRGGPSPTTDSFNRVLRAWATSPEPAAVDRAQVILNLMLQLQASHPVVQPNVDTFATIILACAKHNRPLQAEVLWNETVHYFQKQQHGRGVVDLSRCLHATTLAWSQSTGEPNAVQHMESILQEWFRNAKPRQEMGIVVKSMGESMAHIVTALVQQGAVQEADAKLRQFWRNHIVLGDPAPFSGTLHFVITSYRERQRQQQSGDPSHAELATKLLLDGVAEKKRHQSLKRPDAASYNLCLQMCLDHYPHTKPLVMDILDAAEQMRRATVYTYKLIIEALCRERTAESAMQALRVLDRLHQRDADPQSWVELRPQDVGIYTKVLAALGAAPDLESANACLDLFQYLQTSQKWRLSTRMYTAVIFNLRKMGQEGRQRAFELFEEMVKAEQDPASHVQLDSFVFVTVLRVLVADNDVSTAKASLEVLKLMINMYDNGRKDLIPDQQCLDVCLSTLALSGNAEMRRVGLELLQEIQKRHVSGLLPALPSENVVELLWREAH